MERRTFILSLLAVPAAVALKSEAKAAPVLGSLPQPAPVPVQEAAVTLPDGTPVDYAQYRHRRRRRRRTVCTWRRNRYGRRVRVCRTVWY
jgi:hypothetical protein